MNMTGLTKQEAALRAAEIAANTKATHDAVARLKAISPIRADQPVPEAVAAATAAVRRARELHDHLLGQKLVAESRKAELANSRKALAFSALGSGDPSAKQQLDEATAAEIAIDHDIKNLDAAIATAATKIEQLAAEERREERREDARAARAKLALMRKAGQEAGQALDTFSTNLRRFEELAGEVRRLGVGGMAGADLVRVNARRSIDAMLMNTGLQHRVIAPKNRIDLASLVDTWTAQVDARLAGLIGDRDRAA
jgi:hypothetical protein